MFSPDLTSDNILTEAQEDETRIFFAPISFKKIFKAIEKEDNPEKREMIIFQGAELYHKILEIRTSGLEEAFRKIQNQQQITAKQELEFISTFHCFSMLKENDQILEENLGDSLEEAREILFNKLKQRINVDVEIDSSVIDNFLTAMDSPAPFLIYYLQYEESDDHALILRNIFESILQDRFQEWKFGEDTMDNLSELKEKGYLPSKLSIDQYRRWREDDQTSLYESLNADSKTVVSEIRRIILENNEEHLAIEALDEINDIGDLNQVSLDIQEEFRLVGQKLGPINRRLGELRRKRNDERLETLEKAEFEELKEKQVELEEEKKNLVKNSKFLRLCMLTPEEVAAGYLLKDNNPEKKGEKIDKFLRSVASLAPQEADFLFQRIERLLTSLKGQTGEKQNLICLDTNDPKITLEIGEKPVPSCQEYSHGSQNDCLLGYFSHNTKILALKNEKGNLVARSIFRLLEDENGDPQLHAEMIYSASASPVIEKSLLTHAIKKAEMLEAKLFVTQGFNEEEDEIENDFKFTVKNKTLLSKGSRAPKVYVDSVGGEQSRGKYKMRSLMTVERS